MKNTCTLLTLLLFLTSCSIEEEEPVIPTKPPQEAPDPKPAAEDKEAPSVPEGLVVSEVSFESLLLRWEASSDNIKVTQYEISINNTAHTTTDNTSVRLSNLSPGTKYRLQVRAADAAGNFSKNSEILEASTLPDHEPPTIPTGLKAFDINPTSFSLSWTPSTDNAGVLDYDIYVNNSLLATTASTTHIVQNLQPKGSYELYLQARDIYGNISEPSEHLRLTTPDLPEATGLAVLISEYVEGTGHNKALEVVNLTNASIDLSEFSFKKVTNDHQNWTDEKVLEGQLDPGEVFVLAHSRANEAVLMHADMSLGAGIMNFNGNDVIGLFFKGELLDQIGFKGGADFAKDVTLRRKTSVQQPNPNYDPEEWEHFATDTFNGLGSY